jgi:signal transduction histidine kinase
MGEQAPVNAADAARSRILYELGCAFAARLKLEELVPLVISKCREALDAEGASVLLLDVERNELSFPFVADEDAAVAERLRGLRFRADQGIAGAVLHDGKPVRVDDVSRDSRFNPGVDRRSGFTTRNMLCVPLRSPQGTIGTLQVVNRRHGTAFTDDDLAFLDALAGSVAVAIDNAQLHAALAKSAEELERKVIERTQELRDKNQELEAALQRLQQLQRQLVAQEKLASLGQLTAGIAHEIKNPLNFVTNFAELSQELVQELRDELAAAGEPLAPDVRASVDSLLSDLDSNVSKINEHGQRADRIVRGMLQHSRSGRAERVATDLNALVIEAVGLAYHGWRARDASFNVRLETDYDAQVGTVEIVAQDISRVVLNLVNNACYAVRVKQQRGAPIEPTVRVTTKLLGDAVEIRVRDNGDGIPAAAREHLFEPFFTTKPPGEGTGLGLSLSYDIIVQRHHGVLRCESEEGEFAELIVQLPRRAVAAAAPARS